jgi:hypothetical protein
MKTVGEYYRERVLSLPKRQLRKVQLLHSPENLRIEKDLFGWKLFYTRFGRNTEYFMECHSEEEARYLKTLFELGMSEVRVPKDEVYLKSILPELERIKNKLDEILNSYMETLVSRKIRERLKSEVYMEIIK